MSQRKRLCSDKASNLSIKQFFSSKPKTPAVAALNLETAIANSTTSSTVGILDLICSKRFLFSLYLLNAILKHLNKLSMLFQKGSFNFSHIQSALSLCQKEIKKIADSDQVINSLKVDWGTISKFLPKSQNQFLGDIALIRFTVKTYCEALLRNLKDRFPKPEVLFAFRIFDVNEILLDAHLRQCYGNHDLQLLLSRFGVASAEKKLENTK